MQYNGISLKIKKFAEVTFLLQVRNISNYMILVYIQKTLRKLVFYLVLTTFFIRSY